MSFNNHSSDSKLADSAKRSMDSVPILRGFFNFRGTASRAEFIPRALVIGLAMAVGSSLITGISLVYVQFSGGGASAFLISLVMGHLLYAGLLSCFSIALMTRRFKDMGISGWWYAIPFLGYILANWTDTLINIALIANVCVVIAAATIPTGRLSRK